MKIWLDDIRIPPDDSWKWAKTVKEATNWLKYWGEMITHISLDNDLGGDSLETEGRRVVLFMAEHNIWPKSVTIHSANPVARDYMLGMIDRYKPD